MNLSLLKSFHKVVTCKSISKAAKMLHISQPALSIQIQTLENEFGIELLKRSNKGVETTEAGKTLFNYSHTLITLTGNLLNDIEAIKAKPQYKLKVGSCPSISQYALPCTLFSFKELHPKVDLSLLTTSSSQVIENLLNYSIDIGFVEGRIEQKDIINHKIMDNELLLILPPNKYFKGEKKISIEAFLKLPLILSQGDENIHHILKTKLLEHGLKPEKLNILYQLDSIESIKSSVINGSGVSLLPYITVKEELEQGTLETKSIEDIHLSNDFSIIYSATRPIKKEEEKFINFIKKYGKKTFCFQS